jgi:murein DD-endopeptidase MepM/ murein hydrolase activator NlpD
MKHALLVAILTLPLPAQAFGLQWPVACEPGKDCFIQNYVDRDPAATMKDYRCGDDVYENGHDGTDIRLRSLADMRRGVAVLAAADGTVWRVRDGAPDIANHGTPTDHQDCGNAVIVNHAEGYDTMYCHLQQGSIRVRPGQQVKAGEPIGQVGMSGMANFPHLHFTLHRDRQAVDPFDGKRQSETCSSTSATGLWKAAIPYRPSALLNDGFSGSVPQKQAMRDTPLQPETLPRTGRMLIYWFDLMSVRAGDRLSLSLEAPNGTSLAQQDETLDKAAPFYFGYIGKILHEALPAGAYKARLSLRRNGEEIVTAERRVGLR